MKKHLYILTFVAIGFAACGPVYVVHQDPPPQQAPAPLPPPPQVDPSEVTYQNFYDDLSPYGQWIDDPNYGYAWLPDVGPDFKPYSTNGHWVYTDEGWAWDSGYPWGWAAFHYGRWFFQDGYGWMWLPGNEWAPAWVSWRNSDDYYGWAPMGPNVSYSAAYGGGYAPPSHYWCFVPHRYIASPQINNYYVRETNNVTIINRTTIINNTTIVNNTRNVHYGAGPDPNEVGRYSGGTVRPMSIRNGRNPGDRSDNGNFTVYRPRVNGAVTENRPGNSNSGGRSFAPTRVQTLGNARPVNRTVYGNGNDNRGNGNDNRGNGNAWGRDNGNNRNDNRGIGNDNRGNGNDNRGNGNDNRGNGNDNRGNGNDNRGNGNAWGRDNGNNGNGNNGNNGNGNIGNGNNGNGNNGNNNGRPNNGFPNRGGYQQGNQPVNQPAQNQPAQNQPAQNQPAQNQPAQNQPVQNQPANNGQQMQTNPFGRPTGRPYQPNQQAQQQPAQQQPAQQQPVNNQPVNNPPVSRPAQQPTYNQPNNQPANQPAQQQRPVRPNFAPLSRPAQAAPTQQAPTQQQPRPVVNQPRPTPPAPQPPRRDDKKDDNGRPGRG